jgi:hypothetical protein
MVRTGIVAMRRGKASTTALAAGNGNEDAAEEDVSQSV